MTNADDVHLANNGVSLTLRVAVISTFRLQQHWMCLGEAVGWKITNK